MTRARDVQKSRFHASEWEVFGDPRPEFKNIKQLEAYVWEVLKNWRVQKRYPAAREMAAGVPQLRVHNGGGMRRPTTKQGPGFVRMSFPPRFRCRWMVVHEIAHLLAPPDAQAHGREYARVYLHLTKLFFGRQTQNKLKVAMKKHNCKYSKPHSPFKGPLTQEQKSALLARLESRTI